MASVAALSTGGFDMIFDHANHPPAASTATTRTMTMARIGSPALEAAAGAAFEAAFPAAGFRCAAVGAVDGGGGTREASELTASSDHMSAGGGEAADGLGAMYGAAKPVAPPSVAAASSFSMYSCAVGLWGSSCNNFEKLSRAAVRSPRSKD